MGKMLAAWIMLASAIAVPAAGPRETVEQATTRVFGLLQAGGSGERPEIDRPAEIRRITRELFDFTEVARRALSRHWAARTSEEQTEFVALFSDLLERLYLTRIDAYASDKIVFTGETVDGTFATVRSRLAARHGDVTIDYRLHLRDHRWQVYDAVIDGTSFVSTFRAQFDRVIQAESYGALVERLRERAFAASQVSHAPGRSDAR